MRRGRVRDASATALGVALRSGKKIPSWLTKRLSDANEQFRLEVAVVAGRPLGGRVLPADIGRLLQAVEEPESLFRLLKKGIDSGVLAPDAWQVLGHGAGQRSTRDRIRDCDVWLRLLHTNAQPRASLIERASRCAISLVVDVPPLTTRLLKEFASGLKDTEAGAHPDGRFREPDRWVEGALDDLIMLASRSHDRRLTDEIMARVRSLSSPKLDALLYSLASPPTLQVWLNTDAAASVLLELVSSALA